MAYLGGSQKPVPVHYWVIGGPMSHIIPTSNHTSRCLSLCLIVQKNIFAYLIITILLKMDFQLKITQNEASRFCVALFVDKSYFLTVNLHIFMADGG